jgi:hypothetical protein
MKEAEQGEGGEASGRCQAVAGHSRHDIYLNDGADDQAF